MNHAKASSDDNFERTTIVAGCVIKQDDKYLLVQEKKQAVYGLWNLPAGHVDKGESIEQAAIREAKEETGFDVQLGEKLGVYHDEARLPSKHAFRASIVGGKLQFQAEELLDANWFSYQEIKVLHNEGKTRNRWVFDAITEVEKN